MSRSARQIGPSAKRAPVWLPYLNDVEVKRGGVVRFSYNGGVVETDLSDVSSIMVYGSTEVAVPLEVLDLLGQKGIPLVVHRRHKSRTVYVAAGPRPDPDDTLSAQLTKRQQSRTSSHIARQLLVAKMRSMSWLVEPVELPQFADVSALRVVEARHAATYWKLWMGHLGRPEWTRRGTKNPASASLDSVSKFVSGVTLRWITYHHLSPYHGFLHTPTDYPALVYDLMEPYRGLIERELLVTWVRDQTPEEHLTASGIEVVKAWLRTPTYVPLTRQIAANQELLHGAVISLKRYLLGPQRKFHVPLPGPVKGGRPPKVDFLLYGTKAGRTDFWDQARAVTQDSSPTG